MKYRYWLIAWCICSFTAVAHAQQLNWGQINSAQHDIPFSAERGSGGIVWMAGVTHPTYISQRDMIVVKLSEDGVPLLKKEIHIPNISIHTTGGIFEYEDSLLVIFATFSLDTPFDKQEHWGYLVLDSEFKVKQLVTYKAAVPYGSDTGTMPFFTHLIKAKKDISGGFFGTLVQKKQTPMNIFEEPVLDQVFNTYFIFDKQFQLTFLRVDTLSFNSIDLTDGASSSGDMIQLNESDYFTIQPFMSSYICSKVVAPLYSWDTSNNYYSAMVPDTSFQTYLSIGDPYNQLAFWDENHYLYSGQLNRIENVPSNGLGQSMVVLAKTDITIKSKLYSFQLIELKRYTLTEPTEYSGAYSGIKEFYTPAIMRSFDFIDKNHIFYTRANLNLGFYYPCYDCPSGMMVSMLDSMLNVKWTRFIGDTNDLYLTQHPYTIVATHDGGCLVFARKQVRLFDDPFFRYPAPEWDIVVYKINDEGEVLLSTPLIEEDSKFNVYPNPVVDFLYLSNNTRFLRAVITDIMGVTKYVLKEGVDKIDVSELPTGLYFIHIETHDGNHSVVKFVKK